VSNPVGGAASAVQEPRQAVADRAGVGLQLFA
jgi:hypothetical protein